MLHFIYNGKIFPDNTPIAGPDNRGLRYGDGLFETLKAHNGEIVMADEHLARLWKGLQLMRFTLPKLFTPDLLLQQMSLLLKKNNFENARIRLAVTRGDGGLYDAKNNHPNYVIQAWQLPYKPPELNENGLQLCIYQLAKKSLDAFCNLKHNNFLPYVMGALFARESQCNDAIILNSAGRVADTTLANIFLVKDQRITTPALEEGCIAGVMRKFVILTLQAAGYTITEEAVSIDSLMDADEMFLSNSIFNIKWVNGLGNKKYNNFLTREIYQSLRQTNPREFC